MTNKLVTIASWNEYRIPDTRPPEHKELQSHVSIELPREFMKANQQELEHLGMIVEDSLWMFPHVEFDLLNQNEFKLWLQIKSAVYIPVFAHPPLARIGFAYAMRGDILNHFPDWRRVTKARRVVVKKALQQHLNDLKLDIV